MINGIKSAARVGLSLGVIAALAAAASAQTIDKKSLAGLEWRSIGPYRGGRSVARHPLPDTGCLALRIGQRWTATRGGSNGARCRPRVGDRRDGFRLRRLRFVQRVRVARGHLLGDGYRGRRPGRAGVVQHDRERVRAVRAAGRLRSR